MANSVDRCRDDHLTEDEEDENEKETVEDPRNPNTTPLADGHQSIDDQLATYKSVVDQSTIRSTWLIFVVIMSTQCLHKILWQILSQ